MTSKPTKTERLEALAQIFDLAENWLCDLQLEGEPAETRECIYYVFAGLIDFLGYKLTASSFVESMAELAVVLSAEHYDLHDALLSCYGDVTITELYQEYKKYK